MSARRERFSAFSAPVANLMHLKTSNGMKLIPAGILPFFIAALFLTPLSVFAAARPLTLGLSGSDVTELQKNLITRKYLADGSATGYFGPRTLEAVQKYQCEKGIVCSGSTWGLVGPKTQSSLGLNYVGPTQQSRLTGALTPKATGAFEYTGWIPDWRAATATADVLPHLNQMTSVMPFSYSVNADGTLRAANEFSKEPWASFIAEAKRQKVRVVPTILWTDAEAMHRVLSNTTQRIALEDEIAALVKQNDFDGIDIDFEAKKAETINYFSTFLKGLYQRMGNKWVYCAIEARMPLEDRYPSGENIPPDATQYANDYAALNKYCDRIMLMTYDQGTIALRLNAARSAPYAPVADPGWVENVVDLAARSISRNKLVVGIPTYGYEYKVTPLSGSGYQYKRLWAFNPNYATGIAAQLGVTPTRTSANELGFIYNPDLLAALAPAGNNSTQTQQNTPTTSVAQNLGSQVNTSQPFNYMTWSDAQAMKDKIDLAKRLGVRGVAFFSLGGAEDQGLWGFLPTR